MARLMLFLADTPDPLASFAPLEAVEALSGQAALVLVPAPVARCARRGSGRRPSRRLLEAEPQAASRWVFVGPGLRPDLVAETGRALAALRPLAPEGLALAAAGRMGDPEQAERVREAIRLARPVPGQTPESYHEALLGTLLAGELLPGREAGEAPESVACASGADASRLAEGWIRSGECGNVLVVQVDDEAWRAAAAWVEAAVAPPAASPPPAPAHITPVPVPAGTPGGWASPHAHGHANGAPPAFPPTLDLEPFGALPADESGRPATPGRARASAPG